MAEILASDVTVTVTERLIQGRKRIHRGRISFGNDILTMPTAGIPIPAISAFGFLRELATLDVKQVEGTSVFAYEYQATSNTLIPTIQHTPGSDMELNAQVTGAGSGFNTVGDAGMVDEAPERTELDYVATGW